jgi:hypothetical protein
MSRSKISLCPSKIREQLNQRLDSGQKSQPIADWLNSLPEVQAVLKEHFAGEPVKRQNLEAWKKTGFRHWQLRQTALQFTEDALPDDLDQATLDKMSDKLLRMLQIRYAALASNLPPASDDPETELRRLGELCNNLVMLRRGDLSAGRLAVEQERLAMEKVRSDDEKEAEHWEWTKRPDIQAKLYPHRDPDQQRRDVDRLITERLLGIRHPETNHRTNGHEPEPACLI